MPRILYCLPVCLWLLTGCATSTPWFANQSEQQVQTEALLYQAAQDALTEEDYTKALQKLQALEARYPFGRYAEQVQLELIYTQYQLQNYDAAAVAAGRFIRLHPQHEQVDYAYYLRGLSSWSAGRHALEWLELIDISQRDPGATRDAYQDFSLLVRRYPQSPYAADAYQRLQFLKNLLARQEIYIGRYYLKRGAYIAAVNRGREVLEAYPDTPATRDALAVMAEAYTHLQQTAEAQTYIELLQTYAPTHPQLSAQGFQTLYSADAPEKSMLQILTFDILK